MMKILYIARKDPNEHKWYPVGRLCCNKNKFIFCYTKGAEASPNFVPFGQMNDFHKVYTSERLFPFFENRVLNKSRPEFKKMMDWLDLKMDSYNPLDVLALTEGKRGTDDLEIFPCPTIEDDNVYRMSFFSHGLRHIDPRAMEALEDIKPGDLLYLVPDPQNRYDGNAIMLRSDDPVRFAGYCPRYLVKDFKFLINNMDPAMINIQVKKINRDAPLQYRMMCSIRATCPKGFKPCSDELFHPLASNLEKYCIYSPKKNGSISRSATLAF